jgi:hypothetical protein
LSLLKTTHFNFASLTSNLGGGNLLCSNLVGRSDRTKSLGKGISMAIIEIERGHFARVLETRMIAIGFDRSVG